MKKYLFTAICILTALLSLRATARAATFATTESAVAYIREQLIFEEADEVTVMIADQPPGRDIYQALITLDETDTLYDGMTLAINGSVIVKKKDGLYTVSHPYRYNIADADLLTDKMAQEVYQMAGKRASDRELMYALCEYVTDTFCYNKEELEARRRRKDAARSNFVDAYYGDRLIVCDSFATVTYLVANKLGIDCQIIYGNGHAYNAAKFNGETEYIGFDLTKQKKYAYMTEINELHQVDIIPKEWIRETAALVNTGKEYRLANLSDRIRAFLFFALKRHHTEEFTDMICLIPLVVAVIVAVGICGERMARSLHRSRRRVR